MKRSNIKNNSLSAENWIKSNWFLFSFRMQSNIVLVSILMFIIVFITGAVSDDLRPDKKIEFNDNLNIETQNTPPPQVLKDLEIPAVLWENWQNQQIRLEPGEVRFARAPAQTMQRLNRRWNEDFVMEAALHEHGNWNEIRSTEIGDVIYIQPRSGMLRNIAVKQEEAEAPGFQRWVYYQYEDLSALGMDDHFIPRVAVEAASDGSAAYFIRLDPDGQTGHGHFGKSGWSIENGKRVLWVYTISDTDWGASLFGYEDEGDTAKVQIYDTDRRVLGSFSYHKNSGEGNFTAPGQNNDQPVCWDVSMNNREC
jgi:hypothetical protein